MKKILLGIFVLVLALVFAFSPSLSFAQSSMMDSSDSAPSDGVTMPVRGTMMPPDYYPGPGGSPLPFAGENHRYSVVLRGNGEAIITLKAALTNINPDGSYLNTATFRLPLNIAPSDIAVYQIIAQGYCIRYEDQGRVCMEYSEPDYYNYYGGGKYQRAKYDYSGDTLTITLPTPILPEKSGAFFVYFRAMGYARRNLLGAFKYSFESFKTNDQISELNVGISTDSDLFMKGAQGKVNYRFEAGAMMKADSGAPMANSAIDRVVSQIGQGTITKTASNLAPLESYKVSGMYADSRIKLYSKEIMGTLAVVLIILAVILLIVRKFVKMINPSATRKEVRPATVQNNSGLFLTAMGISFVSSLFLAGYSILLLIIFNYFNNIDYQMAQLLRVATIIFSFCIYSVGLFIPGIYYGYKKAMGWGILTVALTVGWLFIYFAIGFALVFFLGPQNSYPVVPMMREL